MQAVKKHGGCSEARLCKPCKPSYGYGYASSKPRRRNCFSTLNSLLKTLALYEILPWLQTLTINLQEGTRPKSDRRKEG